MRPMPNELSTSNRDKIRTLVQFDSKVFFDRPDDSSLVIPTRFDGSIQPAIVAGASLWEYKLENPAPIPHLESAQVYVYGCDA